MKISSKDNEIQLLNDHHSVSSSDSVQMIMSPPNLQENLFGTNKKIDISDSLKCSKTFETS